MEGWDATETAARVRARDVSATEVVEAAIERAERAAHLGAVVTPAYDRAREFAARVGDGAFAGVPTFVKDQVHLSGVRTRWGSRACRGYVPRQTDAVVQRFQRTGTIILGKSATPELGHATTTEPAGSPPCRNPWDLSRSPGGSSGGSASLVAAGVVPMAHASDGGGSIRIPAACCGLVGLKVSRYRLDAAGSRFLPVNVGVDGVLTRSVRDTARFYQAIEQQRGAKRVAAIGTVRDEPGRALRIGVFTDAATGRVVDDQNRKATLDAALLCEQLGHRVDVIECPFDNQVLEDYFIYWGFIAWLQLSSARASLHWSFDASKADPWTCSLREYFSSRFAEGIRAMLRLRRFHRVYAKVFRSFDVLACPTLAQPAPPLGHLSSDVPFEIVHERVRCYTPFTPIHNVAGAPALSLPLGATASGVPLGVQFAAAHGADTLLLELAASIEKARPWTQIAPHTRYAEISSDGARAVRLRAG